MIRGDEVSYVLMFWREHERMIDKCLKRRTPPIKFWFEEWPGPGMIPQHIALAVRFNLKYFLAEEDE
jgi:hypothetical protein